MDWIPASIRPFMRSAFLPKVSEGDCVLKASKFSGKPWLNKNEHWPVCQDCSKPMQLFLQLNLDSLPESIQGEFGTGLLQLFYCTSTIPIVKSSAKPGYPLPKVCKSRVVQPDIEELDIEIPDIEKYFPPKQIVGWKEIQDYPHPEEGTELGIDLTSVICDKYLRSTISH